MAKKKFNISSTLSKNKKQEVELAAKVPLKKTTKDPEAIKSKVEKIHADEAVNKTSPKVEENAAPTSAAISPKPIKEKATPSPKSSKAKPKEEKQRMVRMTIDTPEEMHLRLKIKSIQARTSMREYVLKLIEKDLKKG